MGNLNAGLFISLDGVIEDPQDWHFDYFNEEMGAAVGALMGDAEATLLGRRTYDGFAEFWPNADPNDPMTQAMNEGKKYVISTTLAEPTWQNTTVINGDIAAELTRLKSDTKLSVTGSAVLVRWLLEQHLVDELHLFVHPVVVGQGQRLFPDGSKINLALLRSTTFSTGVVHLVYGAA